jgi:pyruvate dehydrogenase E2 component (dihydrolipoamide acetyltransferase)
MIEFVMPSLGADMEEGTFIEWRVQAGQVVKRGDVVCVVETQKGAVEVEIWQSGTVARLIAQPGEKIPVGHPLALVAAPGEKVEAAAPAAQELAPANEPAEPASRGIAVAPALAAQSARTKVSPAARRRAQELGIDLSAVSASAQDGVVSLEDVERYAARMKPDQTDRQASLRTAIGATMARSKREIPHYYLGSEINVERAGNWLDRYNATRPVSERMLFAAIELKAVALALRETIELNGWFVEQRFRGSDAIHIGVAVALRGGGLIAPALHDTDKLSLSDLMRALADLLTRARTGQLRSSELADATITVTNLGELGVDSVYGVIYPPQVALVGFGRVAVKPWVENGTIVPARVVHASLSADHRVTDGMVGARFLARLAQRLLRPEEL